MGKLLLALFILLSIPTLAQQAEPKDLFSQAIGKNIRKYRKQAKLAYIRKDEERAQFLFDSLVKKVVNGSYIDNFKVRKFTGRRINLYKFEKPIYLITYASWCVPGKGEVPAFNDVAEKYHDQIDFVMLYWGSKKKIRKSKRKISKHIHVLYVDEKENRNDFAIRTMKHSLGFPTSFFISADKRILDVRRNFMHHYSKEYTESYNSNYQSFTSGISLLQRGEVQKELKSEYEN
ncbi:redoxin domain-containing protein [Aureisphaera galaxeae]|uniref:TlpA family protein disulfide reductase n=1 Tax=Aureisphaera galaxeae TaxID=1538023 RepID=UPI00234FC8DF|nr:redoxin domain-containing protein [Aureisphaera galaxeae]MDC8003638.1 redoxin domain-containing protein [Aureisphaera galaxeae]